MTGPLEPEARPADDEWAADRQSESQPSQSPSQPSPPQWQSPDYSPQGSPQAGFQSGSQQPGYQQPGSTQPGFHQSGYHQAANQQAGSQLPGYQQQPAGQQPSGQVPDYGYSPQSGSAQGYPFYGGEAEGAAGQGFNSQAGFGHGGYQARGYSGPAYPGPAYPTHGDTTRAYSGPAYPIRATHADQPAPSGPGDQPNAYLPQTAYRPYGPDYPNTIAVPYTVTTLQPKSHRGRRIAIGTLVALAVIAAGGAAGAAAVGLSNNKGASTTGTIAAVPVQTVVNSSNSSITTLVKAVDPVVVSLVATGSNSADEGSGIILKSTGVILTNNHVVSTAANGGSIEVTFTDGSSASATIVASDAADDLAIVKASGVSGLATATLADSDDVKVGDSVVAIGNELGLSNSVSAGIVSALHRKVTVGSDDSSQGFGRGGGQSDPGTTYSNAIQTDASINQGDSGGALFNMQGQVIGIDSAIETGSDDSAGSVGVGFAIAINDAKAFISANS